MPDPLDDEQNLRPSPCAPWWKETPIWDAVVAELGEP